MSHDPDSLVRTFISSLCSLELESALGMVTSDCEYDNVPLGKIHGPEGIRSALSGYLGTAEEIDWVITAQVSTGTLDDGLVLNERDDRVRIDGTWRSLPVCGVFVVTGGRISLWRDYFDRGTLAKVMAREAT